MSSAFEGLPKTPNLKLNKPGYDNVADIEALNENADILDEEIQGIKNTFVKSVNGINAGDDGNVDLGIIPIANGGTGATTASDACKNLGILDLVYPVGSLYWSKKSTDPARLFGGTWTQIKDKFILAAGDSYAQGATGGSATVALTTAQLPAHNHSGSAQSNGSHSHSASSNSTGEHIHNVGYNTGNTGSNYCISWVNNRNRAFNDYGFIQSSGSHSHTITVNSAGAHTHNLTINNTGSGEAHNNMPPYVTYYCWERTA